MPKTRWKFVAVGLLMAVIVGFLVLLGVMALGIYTVSQAEASEQTARLQAQSSALQAFAAIAGVVVALVLAIITYWYAHLTKDILEKTGPMASIELMDAWFSDDLSPPGFLLTLFGSPAPDEGWNRKILVKVLNAGNSSVMIETVALQFGIRQWLPDTDQGEGVRLPHRLEGNSSANFFIELIKFDELLSVLKRPEDNAPRTFRAKVELGNGQTVHSTEYLI